MAKIVLDPGHGGHVRVGNSSPNNAVGPTGLLEKTVTLNLAHRAEKILSGRGHTVVLTRAGDVNLGLADRAEAARSIAAPVFVSIHLNAFNGAAQGTETLCDLVHSSASASLCRAVQKRLVAATHYKDRNASFPGGVKSQPLGVLKASLHHADTACCLAEVSFMDVPAEEARLRNEDYLDRLAHALADGIVDHLGAGRLEALALPESFEDGFTAEGGVAAPLPPEDGVSVEPAAVFFPAGQVEAESNDTKEFSQVEIGDGGAPSVQVLESRGSTWALESFDLPAFRVHMAALGLRYFTAEEFLALGASHAPGGACAGLNTLPPPSLWDNILATARMLDEIRHRLEAPCHILSCYRAPAYNSCVGGERGSLHMRFNAIDFRCAQGTPAQWWEVAKAVRASTPAYAGGIGRYASFVHIDTRGRDANW
ncbi:N-acetylmuramoyl-L-alanine amidase [Xanthobacter sp. V4C-4]|uniref:N-acetylmuramoyl-L-alanine amidase n=1 Tax=Xanthobacter cornucopiae TaxID=3119924 RepID=UPI00372CC35A